MGWLFNTMIAIAIIGLIASTSLEWVKEEKIGQQLGEIVAEFKEGVEPETRVETKTITVDRSGVICLEGKKTVTIDGVVYHLGLIKNSWGDLEAVDCQ